MGDGESMEVLHRSLSRYEAFVTEAAAAYDASEEWALDGAKTSSAWIATRCALPKDKAAAASSLSARPCACCPSAPKPGARAASGPTRPGP